MTFEDMQDNQMEKLLPCTIVKLEKEPSDKLAIILSVQRDVRAFTVKILGN